MSNFLFKAFKVVKFIWTLPQSLLAVIMIGVFKYFASITRVTDGYKLGKNTKVYFINAKVNFSGVSLGEYILLSERYPDVETTVKHEEGHTIQSYMLGPLYLIIVGLPSIVMNIISTISVRYFSGKFNDNYYNRWPESWADKLSGITR